MSKKKIPEMIFSITEGRHVLQPESPIAVEGQRLFFEILENTQKSLIDRYDRLSEDEKFRQANALANLFVSVLMNGDQASFKAMLGLGKDLMTKEELINIKKDFVVAMNKKKSGAFKTFLLLDLLPQSNRRADAIIVNNEYQLELYDFSEGPIAKKLKKYKGKTKNLTDKEKEQLSRKEKQQKRIDSFKDKIDMNSKTLEDVIIDNDSLKVQYYHSKPQIFDFNNAYNEFRKRRQRTYIPGSVCLLVKDGDSSPTDLIALPLKKNIDSPYYSVMGKNILDDFIEDIYKNNTNIVISKYYFYYFFEKYTPFEIFFRKKIEKSSRNKYIPMQIEILADGKHRGVMIRDSRTGKSIPFTYGLLFKHTFMNISLKSWCEYISAMCNQSFDNKKFNQQSFYVDKIKKELFFFNI